MSHQDDSDQDFDCNAKEYDRCRSCGSRFETDDVEGIALDECINCEQTN